MGRTSYMNILSHGGTSSQTTTWAPIIHSTIMYGKHSTMGLAPQELTGVVP